MLLVMRWLDEGADDEGALDVTIGSAADALGLETDRAGILAVMTALGELEDRGAIDVVLAGRAGVRRGPGDARLRDPPRRAAPVRPHLRAAR